MGSDQSHEEEARDQQDQTGKHEESEKPEGSTEPGEAELPQCMMGGRRVDSMCFMISCTNWY